MRRIKLFSLIQERIARSASGGCPSRWYARRQASWSASGGSAAVESLESRCLLSAGDLDSSFGVAGRVTTDVSPEESGGLTSAVAIQSDGKIIVASTAYNNANKDFAIVRYNSDGSLDSSFGTDGIVITEIGSLDDVANSVALQSDGKIVVAGKITNGNLVS